MWFIAGNMISIIRHHVVCNGV